MNVCAERECPNLTDSTRCSKHTSDRRRASDAKRPSPRARGYGPDWSATRSSYLSTHPICEDREGCITPATDVHHLDGEGPLGLLGHDPENLQALCRSHHARITSHQQPGGWNV